MKRTIKKVVFMFSIICACLGFSACGTVNEVQDSKESEAGIGEEVVLESESMEDNSHTDKEVEANSYYLLSEEVVERDFTKYGQMKTVHEEFKAEDGSDTYYYDMECFYFDDSYPAVLNETLQAYYDSVEEGYKQDAQVYTDPFEENVNTPYDSLIFQYFTYVGEDYVSLVYNDVCYMGGAHPYSAWDGITIDCSTGEMVDVRQFLDDSDEEIGAQLQAILGMDDVSLEEWDYYLSDTSVVFFYYDPRFWEPVAVRRMR